MEFQTLWPRFAIQWKEFSWIMHEFQTHKFMEFCVQNWEFLWRDTRNSEAGGSSAELKPKNSRFQELMPATVVSLCWTVCAVDCRINFRRFASTTTNACGLVGLCKLVLPPPVSGGISLWAWKGGSWPLRAAGGSLALREGAWQLCHMDYTLWVCHQLRWNTYTAVSFKLLTLNTLAVWMCKVWQLCHVQTTQSVRHQFRCLSYDSYILCTPHMKCVPTLGVLAVKAVS